MRVALTGHRSEDCESEKIVRLKANAKIRSRSDISCIITGMANGFDLLGGDEALNLGVPVICAVPWRGHRPRKGDEELYQRLLDAAESVHYLSESDSYPGAWIYLKRNEWMVDNSDAVMAYWNPEKQSGGTFACRNYAKKVGKPVANIWFDPPF